MCQILNITPSSYYNWLNKPLSKRIKEDKLLSMKIKEIHKESHEIYGCPRITKELKSQGEQVSCKRVYRLMKANGIRSKIKRKYRVTTDSSHHNPIFNNLLNRNFQASRASEKWVSDITYLQTTTGWLYLTIIMDLYDRKIIGWSISDDLSAKSTIVKAWIQAIQTRGLQGELLFHSDRGVQYTCKEFTGMLNFWGNIKQSMSRKANCWDNAVAENFFKALKTEWIYRFKTMNKEDTKILVFQYIEAFYNTNRRHKYLNNLTIKEFTKLDKSNIAA